jgi:hypothetical protein
MFIILNQRQLKIAFLLLAKILFLLKSDNAFNNKDLVSL